MTQRRHASSTAPLRRSARTRRYTQQLAGTGVATIVLLAAVLGPVGPRTAAEEPSSGPCSPEACKWAGPATVALGSRVDVTLALKLNCVDETPAVHFVSVIHAFLDDHLLERTKVQLAEEVLELRLPDHPASAGTVIEVGASTRQLCPMTNDEAELLECVGQVRRRTGTQIHLGIREAIATLRKSRDLVEPWRPLDEVVSIRTSGATDDNCIAAVREAEKAVGLGMYVSVYGAGADIDTACLNAIVSANPDGSSLPDLAPELKSPTRFARLHITETLPANMNLVAAGIRPPASAWDPVSRDLVWRRDVSASQYTLTFQVEPQEIGEWPTDARARAVYVDGRGRPGFVEFPIPRVVVLPGPGFPTPSPAASALPTRTGGSATATNLPVPSPTSQNGHWVCLPSVMLDRRPEP